MEIVKKKALTVVGIPVELEHDLYIGLLPSASWRDVDVV